MYIRRRRRGSSWATTRPTRVMIPTRYRSRTSRTHQRRQRCNLICMRPAPLPTYTCAMQVAACGHGECCSSSLVATVELDEKSYVDGFVARLVAGAVYTISKSEQAACYIGGCRIYLAISIDLDQSPYRKYIPHDPLPPHIRSLSHPTLTLTHCSPFSSPHFAGAVAITHRGKRRRYQREGAASPI